MKLSELPRGVAAIVGEVEDTSARDAIARRLRDLGFVRGEEVRVVAAGPIGAEPLLVQIGFTRFALRRTEAARIRVTLASEVAPPARIDTAAVSANAGAEVANPAEIA